MKNLLLFSLSILLLVSPVFAETGIVVFQNSSAGYTSIPRYQRWNETNFISTANATNVLGTIQWVVLKNNPFRQEHILGTLDSNSDLRIQFFNGSNWSQTYNMTLTSGAITTRSFDIAVEQSLGNVVIAYNNGTAGLFEYKVWNGSSWYINGSVTLNATGQINWIKMDSRTNSSEIMLIVADANSELDAVFWNGTSWSGSSQLETSLEIANKEDFDVAFENSGDVLIAWANSATAAPKYITYSNNIWGTSANAPASSGQTANFQWVRLRNYPGTDRIMLCTVDASDDLNCVEWTGNGWGSIYEIDATSEYLTGVSWRNFDVIPDTSSNSFFVMYGDNNADYFSSVRCFGQSNCQAGAWESVQTFLSGVDIGTDTSWAQLSFDTENAGKITAIMTDQTNQQWRARISCSNSANSCSADETSIFLATSTNNNYESVMFTYSPMIPTQTSISASPDPIKGGTTITITANDVNDENNNTLYFYCDGSSTPISSNTDCTGGATVDTSPPYNLTCTFTTSQTDQTNIIYCRVYDGFYYSQTKSTTYITDSTQPATSILNVAGDAAPTYYDNVNDGWTNITISGEANMLCRWGTSDDGYSSMSNNCSITGTQALCSPITITQGLDAYNFYIACRDAMGNEQNSTNNLDVTNLVTDWTTPTTSDNSSSDMQVPNYTVGITESDNLFSAATVTTKYCTDTSGSCIPDTTINDGDTVIFTSSKRGINFLRYNSSDPAGNVQTVQNKTININQLPVFTSASDNTTIIKGGSWILITTVNSDADSGQTLKLFVCNSTSANSSGCTNSEYCSNTSASTNASCSFTSETDDTTHTWYAFIYDSLNEAAATNHSGSYTTVSNPLTITIVYPENITYNTNSITASVSLVESGNWSGYCLDDCVSNVTMARVTVTYFTASMTGLSDGSHRIVFYVNDSVGNMANSSTRYFSVVTVTQDTTSPTITINSPPNGTYYTSTSVWTNITINENATSANYSLDDGSLQPMSNTSTTSWYKQLTSLSDETYHDLTFYANDTSNNQGNNSVNFYVDTKAPRYSSVSAISNPANQSQSVNCSAYWIDGIGLSSGKVEENSSGSFENHSVSISGTTGWTNYTITGSRLSVGGYVCRFYATDSAGNSNSTETSFTVQDVINPTITITNPTNTTYSQNWVTASIVLSEPGKWANYSLDYGSNVSMSNSSLTIWSATVSGLSDGGHALAFYTADYSNNIGTNNIVFTINTTIPDTVPPAITINSPTNGTYYASTSVWANITTSENASWAGYSLDNGNNVTMTNESVTSWYKQMTTLSNGLQNLTFYANDTSGNMGNSSIRYFYVDTQAPTYSVYNTTPYVANQSQSVTCYAQWTDNINLASGKVAENSSGSFVNHTVDIETSGWTNYTILGNDLHVGIFGCKFYATDSAGNSNSTEISFTVQDVVNPTITITSPINTTYSQNWITASITLSESGKWANYSLDGGSNVSMSNSSLTIWSATVTSLSNAQHTLRFYAVDYSDNVGTNSITLTVDTTIHDTTPPIITVWSPTNGTYYTSSSVIANITLNEAGSSATYSVNGTANVSMNNVSTINWNASISLSDGEHNITFYANDTSTNKNTGTSSTAYFTVDTSAPQNTTQGPSSANDTVDITCYSRWTDNLGLNYGYLEHNETGTAINSSQVSLSGTSGWINATIAASDTNPGIIRCKAYVYDKAGLVNTSTWFVNVTDATNPVVENMTYTPNTTDDLDPNVMVVVTANVSDNEQLSSVILQYKLTNVSTWNTSTMNLVSGNMYTGNFTPTEGNWSFRINATDSYGNENVTSMTNISVFLDRSWTNTTNIPSIKSIVRTWPRVFSLGNLTINNTGDYDLNFTVTSNRDWITFNGTNTSLVFIVNKTGNSTTFNATANTTDFAIGEYTYTITINAYALDLSLVSTSTISGTIIIQNVAGPYFDVKIITYDSSVTQSQTGITLKSSVENVGTEDATGTWLAWTLPSGWSVASGTANVSVGFLGIGETVYNSINVDLSSSADTGQQTLMANASCLEGVTDSDNKTVTISGEVTTTTVPQTVSGGGGWVGGGEIAALKTEKIEIWKTIEIVRGKEDSFTIDVINTFKDSVLENLSLDVKGFLAQYISIEPESFSGVEYGETRNFTVKIKIPTYKGYEEYLLNATIKGKIVKKIGNATTIKNLEIKKYITLIIHEISKEEAALSLKESEQAIKEMKEKKITTKEVENLFVMMKEKLDAGKYEEAEEYSKEILSIKEIAFNAYNLINEIKESIESYSVTGAVIKSSTVLSTQSLLNLAIAAFERGDFETAIERANNAKLTLALETKESDFVSFVDKLAVNMPLLIIIIGFFGIFGYKLYAKANISKKIKDLQNEEDNVRILMRKTQKQYFGRKISGTMYNSETERLEKRLTELKKTIINLRHKRVTLLEPKEVIKSLNEENKEVIKIIKKLQEEYFKGRKITKKTYDQQIEMLNERLAEIEDERLKLEVLIGRKK